MENYDHDLHLISSLRKVQQARFCKLRCEEISHQVESNKNDASLQTKVFGNLVRDESNYDQAWYTSNDWDPAQILGNLSRLFTLSLKEDLCIVGPHIPNCMKQTCINTLSMAHLGSHECSYCDNDSQSYNMSTCQDQPISHLINMNS